MRWTLDKADYMPLRDSKLPAWRWTQESHRLFAPAQLATIRALRPEVAKRIHDAVCRGRARAMTDARYGRGAACPAGTQHVDADDSDASVKERLLEWVPDAGEDVIVLWDERVGAVVPWGMFCDYWDDFCYPASDDNFIVPVAGSWFLWYRHEEQFWFLGDTNVR